MLLLSFHTVLYCQATPTDNRNFPHFKSISKNVTFWEKIYSHYTLTQAVIHDSEDLSKIYDVIPLLGEDLPGAARFNSIFQQHAIEKYRAILKKIANQKPTTPDEKRVAALFTGNARQQKLILAAENVRSQRGQKERFLAGVIHSGRYMQEIKKLFHSYNIPEELAYLPHVESSFNFNAYSKFGAAGIWQFTRETGKRYMAIDYTVDERLDPILAAHAAAKYLKNSYSSLNDWPLALTSYNYGLAGMLRAVNDEGDYEGVFNNYRKGHFKFASRNFYSEFLAALRVARQLEQNRAIKLDPAQSTRYLNLPGYVNITHVSKHFGISIETIKSLNPALLPPILNGEKRIPDGYVLRLPAGKKTSLALASIPSTFFKKEQKPSLFHKVKKGDTAGSIARYHGISLKSLMKANNLDKHATVKLQQRLIIPKPAKKIAQTEKDILKLSPRSDIKKIRPGHLKATPILLASKKQHFAKNDGDFLPMKNSAAYNVFNIYKKRGRTYGYITVQPEESLRLYADWLKTTNIKILSLNRLSPHTSLIPGQEILLDFNQLPPTLFEEKRLNFLQETEEDYFSDFTVISRKIYRVISGDTLWDLCYNKFDIPLWLLRRYNRTINLTDLDQQQELIIPIVQQIKS